MFIEGSCPILRWVAAIGMTLTDIEDRDLHLAIDDATWVLDRMILVINGRKGSTSKKHSLDGVIDDATAKKR